MNKLPATKLIILFMVSMLLLTGCFGSNKVSNEDIVELSFAEAVSFERIKSLDGQMVSIIGFMSTTSPLDGSYIYLQNMPYQSCPFCIPNTNILANTIAVYAPEGQSFKFKDIPVEVTGEIKVEDVTDDLGYSYNYRIVDAHIEKAEVSGLGKDIRIYTELVDQGFVAQFISIFEDVDKAIVHENFNLEREDVVPVEMDKFDTVWAMFIGLNPEDYEDIQSVVQRLQELSEDVNMFIEGEDWESLYHLDEEAQRIWDDFIFWLMKPSI